MNRIWKAFKKHWWYYSLSIIVCVCAIGGVLINCWVLSVISIIITLLLSIVAKYLDNYETIDCGEY